jgi:hypothetical protein
MHHARRIRVVPNINDKTLQTKNEQVSYAWFTVPVCRFWVFILNLTGLACFTHCLWILKKYEQYRQETVLFVLFWLILLYDVWF